MYKISFYLNSSEKWRKNIKNSQWAAKKLWLRKILKSSSTLWDFNVNLCWKWNSSISSKIVTFRTGIWKMFVLEKMILFIKNVYKFENWNICIKILTFWKIWVDFILKMFSHRNFHEINGNSITYIAKVKYMLKVIYIWNSNLYLAMNEKYALLLWKPSCLIFENNWVWKLWDILSKKSSKGRQFMKSLKTLK